MLRAAKACATLAYKRPVATSQLKSKYSLNSVLKVMGDGNEVRESDLDISSDVIGYNLAQLAEKWKGEVSNSPSPYKMVAADLSTMTDSIKSLVASEHPVMDMAAKYLFNMEGKRFRPMLILLTSYATSPNGQANNAQRRLAQITEMIHVASLLHDDVIDEADQRRGIPSLNSLMGNKVSVLAGDFLLARASLALAEIGNAEVIRLLSTVIEHLAKGEVLQMAGCTDMMGYMKKTFSKTGSLVAYSCKAAAILSDPHSSPMNDPDYLNIANTIDFSRLHLKSMKSDHFPITKEVSDAAFEFGKHLGLSYQLIDDLLDFTASAAAVGKPSGGADALLGLSTAPLLFSAQRNADAHILVHALARVCTLEAVKKTGMNKNISDPISAFNPMAAVVSSMLSNNSEVNSQQLDTLAQKLMEDPEERRKLTLQMVDGESMTNTAHLAATHCMKAVGSIATMATNAQHLKEVHGSEKQLQACQGLVHLIGDIMSRQK